MSDVESAHGRPRRSWSEVLTLVIAAAGVVLVACGIVRALRPGTLDADLALAAAGALFVVFAVLFARLGRESDHGVRPSLAVTVVTTGIAVGLDYFVLREWRGHEPSSAAGSAAFFVPLGALRAVLVAVTARRTRRGGDATPDA